jgi:hypothetical protein
MKRQKRDATEIVRALIRAKESGFTVQPAEVEAAWVNGVDLRKLLFALDEARRRGMDVTFQELADHEYRQLTNSAQQES